MPQMFPSLKSLPWWIQPVQKLIELKGSALHGWRKNGCAQHHHRKIREQIHKQKGGNHNLKAMYQSHEQLPHWQEHGKVLDCTDTAMSSAQQG